MTATATSIDAVRALAPLISQHAELIESERRLPSRFVRGLIGVGVFQLLIPRALGGAEADPMTVCQVVEELSKADGLHGWCAMIGASYGLFGGLLPDEAAREIYADLGRDPGGHVAAKWDCPRCRWWVPPQRPLAVRERYHPQHLGARGVPASSTTRNLA